jgi:hypothetical protein
LRKLARTTDAVPLALVFTESRSHECADSPQLCEDYRICTPLPRIGEAEDVANLTMSLLSDAAGLHRDAGTGIRTDGLRGVV